MGPSSGEARDVIIAGGGVNGLVCAVALAGSGFSVEVIDDKHALGGVHRTEFPFAKAPRLATFTGAHRVGFIPTDLAKQLRVTLPIVPRDPSLFVPTTTEGRYILAGAGSSGLRTATGGVVGERDTRALSSSRSRAA